MGLTDWVFIAAILSVAGSIIAGIRRKRMIAFVAAAVACALVAFDFGDRHGFMTDAFAGQFAKMTLLVPVQVIDGDPITFNGIYVNTGLLPAIAMHFEDSVRMEANELSNSDIDTQFELLQATGKVRDAKSGDYETARGGVSYRTLNGKIPKEQYQLMTTGSERLYVMLYARYRDKNTGKKWWVEESCTFTLKGEGAHVCPYHNKRYLSD
jgi:hypothetical protein